MSNLKNSCLNVDYTVHLLVYLKRKKSVPMGSLIPDIATNYRTIRDLVDDMEDEGLIKLDKQFSPRKKFTISLTEKGDRIADKLIEVEEIIQEED